MLKTVFFNIYFSTAIFKVNIFNIIVIKLIINYLYNILL